MKIIKPKVMIDTSELSRDKLLIIERAGRTCYKSETAVTEESASRFVYKLVERGHESVLEHMTVRVTFIVDRGISHEIVRHRVGVAYSQSSTRYCNYAADRFGNAITVIEPFFFNIHTSCVDDEIHLVWHESCEKAEVCYLKMTRVGFTPEQARSVLPTSLKTELVMTANFRAWRHFFTLRCSAKAHPQMRQVAIPLLLKFMAVWPEVFDDIGYDTMFPAEHYAEIELCEY